MLLHIKSLMPHQLLLKWIFAKLSILTKPMNGFKESFLKDFSHIDMLIGIFSQQQYHF